MELTTQELEDIAAARLVRRALDVSSNPSENLVAAIGADLLRLELPTAQAERTHIEQSIANMAARQTVELAGAVA